MNKSSHYGKRERGITLVETIIIVVLLVLLSFLANVCIKILTSLNRHGNRIQTSRDANIFLYNLTKEIRNAKNIIYVSSDTLTFTTYDLSQGYNASLSPVLYDSLHPTSTFTSTVTYHVELSPVQAHLVEIGQPVIRRFEDRATGADLTNYFFPGIVKLPEPLTDPNHLTYVFDTPGGPAITYKYISIHLRLTPGFYQQEPLDYSVKASIRSFNN